MELSTAKELIHGGVSHSRQHQVWADLGAGNGLFTRALAGLLTGSPTIYAVDMDRSALDQIQLPGHTKLVRLHQNFEKGFHSEPLDGVLMANSLHYVNDKKIYLRKITALLKPDGHLILIEYDTNKRNAWVPYPIRYNDLDDLVTETGLRMIGKLAEVPSLFRTANIYSALLKKD
jgi:ubiquinone/menaquinone biosynthesis C-methylase UbiE